MTAKVKDQLGEAVSGGERRCRKRRRKRSKSKHLENNPDSDPEEEREIASSTLKVLASIEQGFRLRHDAKVLGFPRQRNLAASWSWRARAPIPSRSVKGLELTVVGPMQPELAALHKKHQEWLESLEEKGKSPSDVLAAYVDKSVPNLSSIA